MKRCGNLKKIYTFAAPNFQGDGGWCGVCYLFDF